MWGAVALQLRGGLRLGVKTNDGSAGLVSAMDRFDQRSATRGYFGSIVERLFGCIRRPCGMRSRSCLDSTQNRGVC
jgi:hypothetical protein